MVMGLADAVERVIGTSTVHFDSDFDGQSDGLEYPLTSVPLSDPCSGQNNACTIPEGPIFVDGFE